MEGDAEIEGSFLHRWLAGYFFFRVSVFQGFHNNEQVQMRNTIAANFSKQSFKNFKKFGLVQWRIQEETRGWAQNL